MSNVIESIGVMATRASFHARRAWRQMVLDACVGLFLVLMLTIAGGLLVYAAFAFAQTMMPDYAAALSLAVLIGLLCLVVYYVVYERGDRRRSVTQAAAEPVARASVTADASASLPPSAVSLALMAAITVARLCGRSRPRTDC